MEQKAVAVAQIAEQKERDAMGTLTKTTYFGNKKLRGKRVQVKDGDTLWGIARKFNVRSLLNLSFPLLLLSLWWLHSHISDDL